MSERDANNDDKAALYRKTDQDDLIRMEQIFKSSEEQKFTINELENVLKEFNISFSPDRLKSFFLKINISRDDQCDWDEFVSHLMYEFQCDDPSNQKESLSLPIVDKPVIRDSGHRFLIVRIRLNPVMLPDRTVNFTHGNYVTVSKDGTINFWTQDFELQKTEVSRNPNLIVAKTWILELICMPDVNIICTSSIENDLRFYDVAGKNFLLKIIITNLPSSISAMSYWFAKTTEIDSKIILGDLMGNLALIEFNAEMRGPFRSTSGVSVGRTTWKSFCEGISPEFRISTFPKKQKDMIRQVDYRAELNCLISAAECREIPEGHIPSPGLVLTDLGVKRKETIMRMTRGVSCFAYNPSSEVFATGGPDCVSVLRLWLPNLPSIRLTVEK